MHLADGILRSPALLVGANAAGVGLALLAARTRGVERGAAFTGTLAAFVLAAQGLNVPLVPGASAHVIGAGLLTIALGPGRAVLAMTAVLLVQALLFGDGGLTVLGINLLNMGVLPVLAVHAARELLGQERLALAAGIGTLVGSLLGAASLGLVLSLGAGVPAKLAFGWLLAVQGAAGLAEAVLTTLAVGHLSTRMPSLAASPARDPEIPLRLDRELPGTSAVERRRGLTWAVVAMAIAVVLLPFASATPDALARVLDQVRPTP